VIKKHSDDRGGQLTALITFYGFLAVFPLLLLLITIAGLVVGPHSHLEHEIVNSALSQFPVIGKDLGSSIKALHKASPLAFVVSALGLLWGSLGATNTIQRASETMWTVPRHQGANLSRRVGRGLLLLGTIGASVVGSTFLAGLCLLGVHAHRSRGDQPGGLLPGLSHSGARGHRLALTTSGHAHRRHRMDRPRNVGRTARQPHPAALNPALWLLRCGAGSGVLALARIPALRLRRRDQRCPRAPPVAPPSQ
jgi:hypothetical protein